MSRKTLAWANKEVETFFCILGEEDVVYNVYVAAAAIDIRPTTKGTVGGRKRDLGTELGYTAARPTGLRRTEPYRALQWKRGISVIRIQLVVPLFPGQYILCRQAR